MNKNAIYKNEDGYLVMKYGQLEFLVCPDCHRIILDEDNGYKAVYANEPLYTEYQRVLIENGGSAFDKTYLLPRFKEKNNEHRN